MYTETEKDSYHGDTVYTLLDMTELKTHVNALNGCGLSGTQFAGFTALIFSPLSTVCLLSSSVLVVYFKCMYQLLYHRKYETSGLFF
jgi:hypothetical protein